MQHLNDALENLEERLFHREKKKGRNYNTDRKMHGSMAAFLVLG
jgi:hypothetical protein